MKNVLQRIAHKGATFTNAFTSSAICCPSRSSILSGQLAHNCATVNNSLTGGCYGDFWRTHVEPRTIAAVANSIGMETFFAGKYLNQVSWGSPINFCLNHLLTFITVPWYISPSEMGSVLRTHRQLKVLQLFSQRER